MFKQTIAAAALLLVPLAGQAQGLIVEAFYDNNTRLFNTKLADRVASVTVYDLSAPDRLEARLSQGLSSDPAIAQKQAHKRLTDGGQRLQAEFQKAYAGPMKAMSYDVEKLPAVVFNQGQHVIYGEPDVNKAVQIYKYRGLK